MELRHRAVGPWPMNSYALVCPHTNQSVLIDPGADPARLQAMLSNTTPIAIWLTHTHNDHIGEVASMRKRLNVPVLGHPGPQTRPVPLDAGINDGHILTIGQHTVKAIYTPGHTGDMVSFLVDDSPIAIVGDTLFAGGPGRTWSAADFQTSLQTLRSIILSWDDQRICYAGHGPEFRLGTIRPNIEAFLDRDHGDFYGDAEW